jgi:spermidine synthase
VMLLLGFQARHGYVYHQLAVLTAGFMAGAALGTWAGIRFPRISLQALQAAAAISPLLLVPVLIASPPSVFPALAVVCGALGGYQFAVASRLTPKPGLLYAVDLAGACAGALLLSAWLIPVYGFLKTAALMAIGNAAAWVRRTPDS